MRAARRVRVCSPCCWAPALLLLLTAGPAGAYRRSAVEGAPERYLYWAQRELHYSINEQGCPGLPLSEVVGAVRRASFAWSSPSCTDLTFVYDGLSSATGTSLTRILGQPADRLNLLVWRQSWPPDGAHGEISDAMPAVTTVVYDTETGEILDADIDLNARDFRWTVGDGAVGTDLQAIVTHELGHVIGLDHSHDGAATMYPTTHPGETLKRELHADDVLGLCTVYPFGGPTPEGAGEGRVPGDGGGGCSVAPGARCAADAAAVPLVLLLLLLRGRWCRRRGRDTLAGP